MVPALTPVDTPAAERPSLLRRALDIYPAQGERGPALCGQMHDLITGLKDSGVMPLRVKLNCQIAPQMIVTGPSPPHRFIAWSRARPHVTGPRRHSYQRFYGMSDIGIR